MPFYGSKPVAPIDYRVNTYQAPSYTANQNPGGVCCPKCKSTQLSANKQGFSGTKAVGGVLLTGGIGALAGTIGSNKIKITCLSCNYQFDPGATSAYPTGPVVFKWSTVLGLLAAVIPFLLIFFLALHFWGFLAALVLGGIYLFVLKMILKP